MTAKKNIRGVAPAEPRRRSRSTRADPAAAPGEAPGGDGLKLREFCKCFAATERNVLYALSLGVISLPGQVRPGSGHHRQFTPLEALGLALALELKLTGMTMPQAVRIANWLLQTYPQSPRDSAAAWWGADWSTLPHRQLILEVAYAGWVRLALDLPSGGMAAEESQPWTRVADGSRPLFFQPITVLRTSISRLAARLQKSGNGDAAALRPY